MSVFSDIPLAFLSQTSPAGRLKFFFVLARHDVNRLFLFFCSPRAQVASFFCWLQFIKVASFRRASARVFGIRSDAVYIYYYIYCFIAMRLSVRLSVCLSVLSFGLIHETNITMRDILSNWERIFRVLVFNDDCAEVFIV